MFHATKTMIF